MRQHRNPFHSSEYTDMIAAAIDAQGGRLADWQFARDHGAGSWYWYSDRVEGVYIYASPFWTEQNDISLQLTDVDDDCPTYGAVAIDYTPTGDVQRDAATYCALVLPMLAILTQRHHAALHPDEGSVHDLSFEPVETDEQRLTRQRAEAIAKLSDDNLRAAIVQCGNYIRDALRVAGEQSSSLPGYRIQLAALEAEEQRRKLAPFLADEQQQGVGASAVLADEYEPNDAERNAAMLDTLGIIDEVCSWAMNEDVEQMDNEQLTLAIARVQDVRDRAERVASPEVREHIRERLAELESEQAVRSREALAADDDDDDIDYGDDDDDESADETFVQELVTLFNNADDDGPFSVEVRRAESFVDADVLTSDAGLRVVFVDGRVYDITVQRGRDER